MWAPGKKQRRLRYRDHNAASQTSTFQVILEDGTSRLDHSKSHDVVKTIATFFIVYLCICGCCVADRFDVTFPTLNSHQWWWHSIYRSWLGFKQDTWHFLLNVHLRLISQQGPEPFVLVEVWQSLCRNLMGYCNSYDSTQYQKIRAIPTRSIGS